MKNKKRKGSKRGAIIALAVLLVLTVCCSVLGVTGMNLDSRGLYKLLPWLPTTDASAWPSSLSLGLDLRGGVYVEYSAAAPEGTEADYDTLLDGTISVIQKRLTDVGYNEATVSKIGTSGIRVEIPDVTDPSTVLELIGSQAQLTFRNSDGEILMDGSAVNTAVGGYDSDSAQYIISLKFTSEGATQFAEITSQYVGQNIGIYLDETELMNPTVNSAITGGSAMITGSFTLEQVQNYAAQIQSGALPMVLTQQKVDTVAATLGSNALSSSITAGIIGILLVMAVMIIRYRMNGVVASWALIIYTVILFFLIAIFNIQLTLPGLAGIVLGIGMAVDANVIIYERFNEEVRSGRPLRAAVRAGFKNALSAIVDANITTMIAAVVLLIFGTGSIQGFGKTLLLGVVVSMFTALLITRLLMKSFTMLVKNPGAYTSGVKAAEKEAN